MVRSVRVSIAEIGMGVGGVLGWLTAAGFLVAGVPLFLRMPPWCDLTLYDVAARTVIAGGVHYRDVFDTNFPGFVWCLIGVRRLFGTSLEAVRAVDLGIVLMIAVLLLSFAKKAGATPLARAWLAAALAALYPFTGEFVHAQRDVWMLLPILAACRVRLAQLENGVTRRGALAQGVLWGLAVWIKPHAMIVAAVVWWRTRRGRVDLVGNLHGGLLVGGLGLFALTVTGTLGPFIEVLTKWSSRYVMTIWSDVPAMLMGVTFLFRPWSLLHFAAVPSAWRWARPLPGMEVPLPRRLLSTLYLAMMMQACVTQRYFDYVHLPVMLLAFAVLAAHRWWWLAAGLAAALLAPAEGTLPKAWDKLEGRHPIRDADRMALWSECLRSLDRPGERVRQQRLALMHEYFPAVNPVQIGEVADWLKARGAGEGDVVCWHDSPHAVYLELGITPRFRFMHITTTLMSEASCWRMTRELRRGALPGAKWLVTDLLHPMRVAPPEAFVTICTADAAGYPLLFPAKARPAFPYCLPVVFRSGGGTGRYLVHRVEPDIIERLDDRRVRFEFEVSMWKRDEP
jgi:hypothetical protein